MVSLSSYFVRTAQFRLPRSPRAQPRYGGNPLNVASGKGDDHPSQNLAQDQWYETPPRRRQCDIAQQTGIAQLKCSCVMAPTLESNYTTIKEKHPVYIKLVLGE